MEPIPGKPVTTAYGKRGPYWSCNPNSAGDGVHTGADIAAPIGTAIYAPIDGQVRHRSYGSAFGNHQWALSPDPGQPFADGEVFFAHTRTRPADGAYVKAGDRLAEVGDEGNVSGPHLHIEYHPTTKNSWSCNVHADPAPVIAWQPEPPDPEPAPPDQGGVTSGFGHRMWYSGKPSGTQTVQPGSWTHLGGLDEPASGIRGGTEIRMLYLRCELPDPRTATRTIETRFIRGSGDATAYKSDSFTEGARDSLALCNVHFEDGDGDGGRWEVKVSGGTDPMVLDTRYSKCHTLYPADPVAAVAAEAARVAKGYAPVVLVAAVVAYVVKSRA